LRSNGFNQITVTAGGSYGSSMNGYYTWARFGYESKGNPTLGVSGFNDYARQNGLAEVRNFKQVMATEQGREWWKRNGRQWSGTFDLKDNSYSMNTLNSYQQERSNR